MWVRINGLIQDIYGLFRSCFPEISGVPVSGLLPGRFLQKRNSTIYVNVNRAVFCGERGSRTYTFKKYHKIANY